jgi:hypothetical protein
MPRDFFLDIWFKIHHRNRGISLHSTFTIHNLKCRPLVEHVPNPRIRESGTRSFASAFKTQVLKH